MRDDDSDLDDLRDLTAIRDLGVSLRAAAAVEDERAEARRRGHIRRRRRLFRIAGPALATSAIAATAIVAPGLGGTSLDPVQSASAALGPDGKIVHLVLHGGLVQPDGSPVDTTIGTGADAGNLGRHTEQWIADAPLRFKVQTNVVRSDGSALGFDESGRSGDGRSWEAQTWSGRVQTDPPGATKLDTTGKPLAVAGSGPATAVKRLLDAGGFREQGTTTIDGREALELVATTAGGANDSGGYIADSRIRYFVDAKNFEPVRIESYFRPPTATTPSRPGQPSTGEGPYVLSGRYEVEEYEQIPTTQVRDSFFDPPNQ